MSIIDQTNNDAAADEGLWLPIAKLAELKGKTRQTVWEKVKLLEDDGLITTRPGPGGTRLVNVAEYDRAVNETTDFARQQGAETARVGRESDLGGDTRMRDVQLQKLRYESELKSIELKKAVGDLVEITTVNDVIAQVAEEIKKPLDQIPLNAEEIVAVAASGGAAAVRSRLREIVFGVRKQIAEALQRLDIRAKSGDAA